MWLLDDGAQPDAIPLGVMGEAVRLVLAGKGVLILAGKGVPILAKRPEPETDVRTGLLHALDLFTVPPEAEEGV